jgi:hypothetical protein
MALPIVRHLVFRLGGGATGRIEGMTPPATLTKKDRLVWLSPRHIFPAPENEEIYRNICKDDLEIQALTDSIREHGIQEPILVSRDNFIFSGHRRREAAILAHVDKVPCLVRDVDRGDPEFMTLLVECNRQRVKNLSEVIREHIVLDNYETAYESLIEHRKEKAGVNGEFLKIRGMKYRSQISDNKLPMLIAVKNIIESLQKYWPLSDRSIHYHLLTDPPLRHAKKIGSRYQNDRASYQDLCDLLTRARLVGEIPFAAIADPTRTVAAWSVYDDVGTYVRSRLENLFDDYWRDLMQTQPKHIEIVGEKNTLQGVIREVAMEYCIPYTIGRGYCSLDPRHQMSQRYRRSGKSKLIILVISDFDPEGEDIPHSFARSMRDDFGIEDIEARKVCLTYDQVRRWNLPQTFDAKPSSSRYKGFAEKYGNRVHEVEALPVTDLSRILRDAIDSIIEIPAFNAEVDAEREDAASLSEIRTTGKQAMADAIEDLE